MIHAFRSEWAKLLRRGQVLGTWGVMTGLGLLLTILLLANAGAPAPPPEECTTLPVDEAACAQAIADAQEASQQSGPTIDVALLEGADGWVFAFNATGQLLGIIALVVAAGNLATEYTSGTLKALLVREPRRTILLGGKIVAVWVFIIAGIAITLALTVLVSIAMAAGREIATAAWFTGEGVVELAKSWLNVTLAAMMWSLLGTMLAMVFRSGPPAIGIGIAYPLLVEGLLGLVLPDLVKWMPGSVLAAVAAGNAEPAFGETDGLGYGPALLLSFVYAVAFLAICLSLLKRRDVS